MPDLKPGEVGSVVDLATVMEVSRQTVHDWINKPGFPQAVDGVFSVRRVVEWKLRREFEAEPRRVLTSDDDPLLSSGDSPGLERYRQAKASLAELDLAEREKTIWTADAVHDVLTIQSQTFRQASETLQRQFGSEAYAILEGAVREAQTRIDDLFGPTDGDDTSGEGSSAG